MIDPRFRLEQAYETLPAHLQRAIQTIAARVAQEPTLGAVPPRALLVGGLVRDLIRGECSLDADIEVFGVPAERLRTIAEELFPHHVHEIGRQFGILHIPCEEGGAIDLALPRRESKLAEGHRGFAIESDPFLPLEIAVQRRDFTINALLWDPLTKELIDHVQGITDLEQGILRAVNSDHFGEDPLRVYRAAQFVSRFSYTIESSTEELLKKMVSEGELDTLSPERITDELKKLFLKSSRPSVGWECLRTLGVIDRSYPELKSLASTPQEPEWHPEGDVWIHTMMCLDQAVQLMQKTLPPFTDEERLQILVGTLCHDLGKPPTTHVVEKKGVTRIRSLGHQEAGDEPTQALCARWSFSGSVIFAARLIAQNHLRAGELFIKELKGELAEEAYANAIRKLLKRLSPLSWRVFLIAAEADYRGRTLPHVQTEPYLHGLRFAELISKYQLDEQAVTPLLQGRDLIEVFGLTPGKQLGELLQLVENARDEGTIRTREEALALIKEKIGSRTENNT